MWKKSFTILIPGGANNQHDDDDVVIPNMRQMSLNEKLETKSVGNLLDDLQRDFPTNSTGPNDIIH